MDVLYGNIYKMIDSNPLYKELFEHTGNRYYRDSGHSGILVKVISLYYCPILCKDLVLYQQVSYTVGYYSKEVNEFKSYYNWCSPEEFYEELEKTLKKEMPWEFENNEN